MIFNFIFYLLVELYLWKINYFELYFVVLELINVYC